MSGRAGAFRGPLYLPHFQLRQSPFTLTPNAHFFYGGCDRGAILQALHYACRHTEGVITLTGEVGTGKTMLSRMLIEHKPPDWEVVYLIHPSLPPDEMVTFIAAELGMGNLEGMSLAQRLRGLQCRLIALHQQGKRVLLLIDEAHVMSTATLDAIRLLSNLETARYKLLRIMLVGQDELERTLATAAMRPLRERITERFHLGGLPVREMARYVVFRVRRAGGRPDVFAVPALLLLAQASHGITRRVHILADKALLAAFADGALQVGPEHVRAAIADARFQGLRPPRAESGRWDRIRAAGSRAWRACLPI